MMVWFVAIGLARRSSRSRRNPTIMWALNPIYGIDFIRRHPAAGFVLLGAVVLAVTGAEALYADMGHFGRGPIRRAWLRFVFPALLLNYFGQGALLLAHPEASPEPVLSAGARLGRPAAGRARLDRDGDRLAGGDLRRVLADPPGGAARLPAAHACAAHLRARDRPGLCAGDQQHAAGRGAATVLGFRSSDALGAAYGIAVTGTMTVTTVLAFIYLRQRRAAGRCGSSIAALRRVPDCRLSFFGANLLKVPKAAGIPLAIAVALYTSDDDVDVGARGARRAARQRAACRSTC